MSNVAGLKESAAGWEPLATKALDEAMWNDWVAKGREREQRSNARLVKAVKWVSLATLFAAAVLGSHVIPYEVVVRFIVSAGALVVMFQAFHWRHYAFAAVFGALVLLYNPVVPVFSFAGDWQRFVVVTSALPFIGALAWLEVKQADRAHS